ncbi:hypothetical protein O4H49_04700 [Kiloniella laminariae]|uniref:Lipoprotein n=1 Tax=Kiloniella laminariae TaxID=454162 RepID=A0ABT4LG34_9PROT|nr:hypothetical protein [Kiloniella laminariae]MCZ4280064.1 hypothetical protein [Kiloniella laminariae]
MKKLVLMVVVSLFLSACVTTQQKAEYTQGQEFEDFIVAGSREVQIPLPEGKWVLAGQGIETNDVSTRFQSFVLIQTENDVLSKIVNFTVSIDQARWGYVFGKICERKDVLFVEKKGNYAGRSQDCTVIQHWVTTAGSEDPQEWIQADRYMDENLISRPKNILVTQYRKVTREHYLNLVYGANPELDGFAAPVSDEWEMSPWHKDRYLKSPDREKYVEDLIGWAKEWDAKVDAGIKRQLASVN